MVLSCAWDTVGHTSFLGVGVCIYSGVLLRIKAEMSIKGLEEVTQVKRR